MATRANIVIKAGKKKIYLYHHYDGYPEGIGKDLQAFIEKQNGNFEPNELQKKILDGEVNGKDDKYEETDGIHSDVEYIYTIDADKGELSYKGYNWDKDKWDKKTTMYKGEVKKTGEIVPKEEKTETRSIARKRTITKEKYTSVNRLKQDMNTAATALGSQP